MTAHSLPLLGRRVLVTGGHRRLGRAVALDLAAAGADIAVHHRHAGEEAMAVAQEIRALGRRAVVLQAELTEPARVAALLAHVSGFLGGLDLVVACAASYEPTPVEHLSAADLDRVLTCNARAPIDLVLQARPLLQASPDGRAVIFGDLAGVVPLRGYLAHSMAKAALHAGVQALAAELAPHIVVNAVVPGAVLRPADMRDDAWARVQNAVPMSGLLEHDPEAGVAAIVQAVRHLATRSRFVTGALHRVDGGRSARW